MSRERRYDVDEDDVKYLEFDEEACNEFERGDIIDIPEGVNKCKGLYGVITHVNPDGRGTVQLMARDHPHPKFGKTVVRGIKIGCTKITDDMIRDDLNKHKRDSDFDWSNVDRRIDEHAICLAKFRHGSAKEKKRSAIRIRNKLLDEDDVVDAGDLDKDILSSIDEDDIDKSDIEDELNEGDEGKDDIYEDGIDDIVDDIMDF